MKYIAVLIVVGLLAISCSSENGEMESAESRTEQPELKQDAQVADTTSSNEPDRIEVQHILIGFKGSIRGKNIERSMAEAQKRAMEIYALAQQGENFDELVKQNTDDAYPGRYEMCNFGMSPSHGREFPRAQMVSAFGDVGFKLKVGEVGIANHDPQTSPFGWHIIKRVK